MVSFFISHVSSSLEGRGWLTKKDRYLRFSPLHSRYTGTSGRAKFDCSGSGYSGSIF